MFYFNNRSLRNFARLRALKVQQRLSVSCVVVAAALSGSVGAAQAVVECQSEKGAGYPWAWREIDGKRCWYKGKPGMDKKLLGWAESANAPATSKASASKASAAPKAAPAPKRSLTPKRSPAVMTDNPAERDHLLHSYWPPLPPADVFNDRFDAARAKKL